MLEEFKISCLGVFILIVIVAFIFSFLYGVEKRKGNLRLGEIIKNVFKKLV